MDDPAALRYPGRAMHLALVTLAAAHETGAPHVHGVSPAVLLVLVAWFLLAAAWMRKAAV